MTTRDQALTPLSVDIEHVVCDMNRLFNPLHKDFMLDYQVQAARDGYVLLTIALPEGMTRVFASMLESMSGFFTFMQNKVKAEKAASAAIDSKELLRRQLEHEKFQEAVCRVFDSFLLQDHSVKESISLTNAALKGQEHPWASYDIVSQVLRSTGRLRKDYRLRLDPAPLLSTSQRADP